MAFFFVCISSLLIISISSYVFQLVADRRSQLPPGPTPLPFIGNLLDVASELPHRSVALSLKPNVSDFFPGLAAADLQGVRRRFARRVAMVYQMIDEQVERRMQDRRDDEAGSGSRSGEKDLLDVMLDISEQGKDDGGMVTINRDVIRTFLTDIFLATVDTISSTIEWAMAELLQHPDTMSKLQEELRRVLGSKAHVEHSDVDRLPYLRAVMRETLRLHPVVPLVPNEAEETVEIHGHAVPKGCTVLVNLWAVHRDAGAWPEPDRFMPERFLTMKPEEAGFLGTTEFEFIPFSAGRRVCLGLPLATRMVHAILGSLMHRFEWTLPPEVKENCVDMSESLGLTMIMATPLQAIAKSVV